MGLWGRVLNSIGNLRRSRPNGGDILEIQRNHQSDVVGVEWSWKKCWAGLMQPLVATNVDGDDVVGDGDAAAADDDEDDDDCCCCCCDLLSKKQEYFQVL